MSLENLRSQWDMRSRPQQKQCNVANCQQTQRKSIRNCSMLPNNTHTHTHTYTYWTCHPAPIVTYCIQVMKHAQSTHRCSHTHTHTHTHTCCDSLLYLRSAGLRWIVIDLCWWAVWGFLSTESSLSVLLFLTHTFPLTAKVMLHLYILTVSFPYSQLSCGLRCARRWTDNLS